MRKSVSILVAIFFLAVSAGAAVPAAAAATAPLEGLPQYDHVFVLVEENEGIASTYSSPSYLATLSKQGAFADHYYAIGHVSLDNYVAMISGQPDQPLTGSDCALVSLYACAQGQTALAAGRNLADQLDDKGVSWKGYMDGTTRPCAHAAYDSNPATFATKDPFQGDGNAANTAGAGPDYADRHNPFLYFPDIVGDSGVGGRCQTHVRPFTDLATDIAGNTVPQFGFITPDTCHDGHDTPCSGGGPGGLTSANAWLQANLPALLGYMAAHNGLLLLTTDESTTTDVSGCCTGGAGSSLAHVGTMGFGGRVGLVALGPGVKAGQTVTTSYDHASLLRTLESLFGISEHLNNADTATAMTDLFGAAAPGPAPSSTPAVSSGRTPGLPPTSTGVSARVLTRDAYGLALVLVFVAAFGALGVRRRLVNRRRSG